MPRCRRLPTWVSPPASSIGISPPPTSSTAGSSRPISRLPASPCRRGDASAARRVLDLAPRPAGNQRSGATSGLYALNQDWPPERGARIARREERADWASVSDEERGEAGCPARPVVLIQRIQATSDFLPWSRSPASA